MLKFYVFKKLNNIFMQKSLEKSNFLSYNNRRIQNLPDRKEILL